MRFPFRNHKVTGLFASLALTIAVPWASAQTVQFQLRNGDRVSGEVVSETPDGLTLKTPWGGTVGIPTKEIVSGRLIEPPRAPSIPSAVVNPVASASPPGATPPKPHKWVGEIQAGVDVLFSEKNRQLYTSRVKITNTYGLLRNLFDYQFAYGRSDNDTTDNRMLASLKTDYDLNRRLYVYNLGGLGYDA